MREAELLVFINRILNTSSRDKASLTLGELKNILRLQGAPKELLQLIDDTVCGLPEALEAASHNHSRPLTAEDLRIASRRGKERIQREAAMASEGRC